MDESKEFDDVGSYVLTTKVALAVAIIRTRPQGMSGKEYAILLMSKYSSINSWKKERVGELEKELQRAKQEILYYKLRSLNAGQSSKTPDCIYKQESDEQHIAEVQNERCLLRSVETLSSYTIYLKGMLSLKSVEAVKMSKLDEDDLSVLRTTICTCLLHIKACLFTKCYQNVKVVKMMETGLRYLSSIAVTFLPNDKFIAEACLAVIEETLGALMYCKAGQYEQQKMFSSVLISLGSIPSVTERAAHKLVALIEGFCTMLEDNPVVSKIIEPSKYISMYYVFQGFEKLILLKGSSQEWLQTVKATSASSLADTATKISGIHPMISYSIWKLITLMERNRNESEEPDCIWERKGK